MQLLDLSQNYFELFGQPVNFDIDPEQLHKKQQELQAIFHPDRFVNAADQDRRVSVQQAARVNEAYQTLVDPVERGRYMLELSGLNMNDQSETTSDTEFLMEQIALREQIEEIRSKDDPVAECAGIIRNLKHSMLEISNEFAQKFEAGELDAARQVSRKMQFIQRILQQAMDLQFQLEAELS